MGSVVVMVPMSVVGSTPSVTVTQTVAIATEVVEGARAGVMFSEMVLALVSCALEPVTRGFKLVASLPMVLPGTTVPVLFIVPKEYPPSAVLKVYRVDDAASDVFEETVTGITVRGASEDEVEDGVTGTTASDGGEALDESVMGTTCKVGDDVVEAWVVTGMTCREGLDVVEV